MGKSVYPALEDLVAPLKGACKEVKTLDATILAREAGTAQAMNVVMLGALSKYTPIKEELLLEALCDIVPKKYLDVNKRAFQIGKAEVE
jgi:indolepyruvate ferredoxin oxidoreductase beta subunit